MTLHIEKTLGKWTQNNQHQHILVKLLGFEKRNTLALQTKKKPNDLKDRKPDCHHSIWKQCSIPGENAVIYGRGKNVRQGLSIWLSNKRL